MGPGIVIPVLVIAVVVPAGFLWARRRFKEAPDDGEQPTAPATRLTSNALRSLATPPWRVVYEINHDRLGGIEHVVIGPAGIFALVTTMEPVPAPTAVEPDPHRVAEAAILRGALDDALRRCAMSSDRLVTVHWGVNETAPPAGGVDTLPGATAVDGRQIEAWAGTAVHTALHTGPPLSPAQVDLAWQTVVTSIGRPDPLA